MSEFRPQTLTVIPSIQSSPSTKLKNRVHKLLLDSFSCPHLWTPDYDSYSVRESNAAVEDSPYGGIQTFCSE